MAGFPIMNANMAGAGSGVRGVGGCGYGAGVVLMVDIERVGTDDVKYGLGYESDWNKMGVMAGMKSD